ATPPAATDTPIWKSAGAVWRSNALGANSGSHSAGSVLTATRGSGAKTQPPAPGEPGPCGLGAGFVTRDLAQRACVIALIIGITSQKLDGESWALQAIQTFNRFCRAPILIRHGGSSRLTSLFRGC